MRAASLPRLVSRTLAWLALVALAACGGGSEPRGEPSSPAERAWPPSDELLERLDADLATTLRDARAEVTASSAPSPGSMLRLGMLLDAHALPAQAAEAYRMLLEREPRHPQAAFHLARCLYELGQLESAVEQLGLAIAQAPERAPAHWRLALWLGELGDLEGARAALERALVADPLDPSCYLASARIELDAGEPALALAALQSAPPGLLERPYARLLLARALAELGRPEDAERVRPEGEAFHDWYDPWVDELEDLHVGRGAELGEALAALQAGRPQQALDLLEKLHADRPDDVTIQGMLAATHAALGHPEDALPMLEAAAARQPQHYRIALNRSINLQACGRVDEALDQAERAVALHPEHATSRFQLGRLRELLGHRDEAVSAYRSALRLGYPRQRVAPRLVRLGVPPEEVGP
ncbi:tetratricopeptide repeat protein [Engelhardtia mirabilis]|uniref:Cellulose synthase subunit BcsC n=1 Tax=Engelhardtia mirabilis TaxID=2528011 RepID=A0A518BN18_9BACT|nr:cellulose synthase subunit BcsC [Planctomycetes bacterium Pla133]QDV02705.1 cellulose synthase subunit BcsC [Planctomycetes bacterium Pla86]